MNVLYIFTNLNWFYIGKNIHTHKHTHAHTYPCHTGRVFYRHHLKWWNEWCCLGPPGCCIICFFFFAILKCTFRNAVFADDDGGNGGGGDGDEEILFAMLHVLLLFWTIVCKQFSTYLNSYKGSTVSNKAFQMRHHFKWRTWMTEWMDGCLGCTGIYVL